MLYTSLVQGVKVFSGEPENFMQWLQSIEKIQRLLDANPAFTMRAALQTSQGFVTEFIQRFIDENPQGQWEQLKNELKVRFNLTLDPMSALLRIRNMKQNKWHSFQMYGEELLSLVPQAFPDADRNDPLIQRELVSAFAGGIASSKIRDKLVRAMPQTLADAITLANQEQRVLDRLSMYHQAQGTDHYQGQRGHNQRHHRLEEPMECDAANFQFTPDGKPVCSHCNIPGHLWRECRKRLGQNASNNKPSRSQGGRYRQQGRQNRQHNRTGTQTDHTAQNRTSQGSNTQSAQEQHLNY